MRSTTSPTALRVAVGALVLTLATSLFTATSAQAAPSGPVRTAPTSTVGEVRDLTLPPGALGTSEQTAAEFQVHARVVAPGIAVADRYAPTYDGRRFVFAKDPLPADVVTRYTARTEEMLTQIDATPDGRAFLTQLAAVRAPGSDTGYLDTTSGKSMESDITVLVMPSETRSSVDGLFSSSQVDLEGSASFLSFNFDHFVGFWSPPDSAGGGGRPIGLPPTVSFAHELIHSLHHAAGAFATGAATTHMDAYLQHPGGVERRTAEVQTNYEELYTTGLFADLHAAYRGRNPAADPTGAGVNIYENPHMTAAVKNARDLLSWAHNDASRAAATKVLEAREAAAGAAFSEEKAARAMGYTLPRDRYEALTMRFATDDGAQLDEFRTAAPDALVRTRYAAWKGELAAGVEWSEVTAADYADPLSSSRIAPRGLVPKAFASTLGASSAWTRAGLEPADDYAPVPLPPGASCLQCGRGKATSVSDDEAAAYRDEVARAATEASPTRGSAADVEIRAIKSSASGVDIEGMGLDSVSGGSLEGAQESAPMRVGEPSPWIPGMAGVEEAFSSRLAGAANAPVAVVTLVEAFRGNASDLQKATAALGVASLAVSELGGPTLAFQAMSQLLSDEPGEGKIYRALWGALLGAAGFVFPPVAATSMSIQAAWDLAIAEATIQTGWTVDQQVAAAYQMPAVELMTKMATSIGQTQGRATAQAVKQAMFRSAYAQSRIDMRALAAGYSGDGLEPVWATDAKQAIQEDTLATITELESLGLAQSGALYAKAVTEINSGPTFAHFRDQWVHEVWDSERGEVVKKKLMAACSFSLVGSAACVEGIEKTPGWKYVTPTDTSTLATSTSIPFDPAAFYGDARPSDRIASTYREVLEPVLFVKNDTTDPAMPKYDTTDDGYQVPRVAMAETIAQLPATTAVVPWRIASPVVSKTGAVSEQKVAPFTAITGTGTPGRYIRIFDAESVERCAARVNAVGMWRCDSETPPVSPGSAESLRTTFLRLAPHDADRVPNAAFELFSSSDPAQRGTTTGQRFAWIADMPPIPDPLTLASFTDTGRTITGQVTRESGAVVPGATVQILSQDPTRAGATGTGEPFSPPATSAADGTFTVTANATAREGDAQLVVMKGDEKISSAITLTPLTEPPTPASDITAVADNPVQITEITATTIRGVTDTSHDVKLSMPGREGQFADASANRNTGEFTITLREPLQAGVPLTVTSYLPADAGKSFSRTFTSPVAFTSVLYATPNRGLPRGIAVHAVPRTVVTSVTTYGRQNTCTTDATGVCTIDNIQPLDTFTLTTPGSTRTYTLETKNNALTPH